MSRLKVFLIVCILFLNLVLRFHNYTAYPQRGATSDEYTYAFLGVSLLTKHIPISWSSFPEYKHRYNLTIKNIYFPIVYPYFDHPPLNGLLVGSWALLFGQNTFEKIDLKTIRMIPIFLGIISSFLVFLIAQRVYSYKIGVWSLLIYSTVTVFIMNTRVVVAENLLTVFMLLSLFLFITFQKKMTFKKSALLGILCGLALWTKVLGISVFFILLFLFIKEKTKKKHILTFSISFFAFVLVLLGYAYYYDWHLFWVIQAFQSGRNIGPETLRLLTQDPVIVNKVFYDGWYFFGFFSLFFTFLDYKKNKFLIIPFFIYFSFLLLSMTKEGHSGWYMIPLFPFMSISAAYLLTDFIKRESFLFLVFSLFIGLSEIRLLYEEPFGINSPRFRILFLFIIAPYLIAKLFNKKVLASWISQFFFYLFILGNIFVTFYYIHPA